MKKITYIEHSGFLMELDMCYMLFDYYKGTLPPLSPEKELMVFASHNHYDHYNPSILNLVSKHPKVTYILSSDIMQDAVLKTLWQQIGIEAAKEAVLFVEENSTYRLKMQQGQDLKITTLHSTDQGVAFLLELLGKRYYHAGDLNLWIWEGEPEPYNTNMKADYEKELEKLKGLEIDVAFVPLDPRQEHNAYLGMKSFLETTKARTVFPMHFWEKPDIIKAFLKQYEEYSQQVKVIKGPGEVFDIS